MQCLNNAPLFSLRDPSKLPFLLLVQIALDHPTALKRCPEITAPPSGKPYETVEEEFDAVDNSVDTELQADQNMIVPVSCHRVVLCFNKRPCSRLVRGLYLSPLQATKTSGNHWHGKIAAAR